MAIGQMFDSPAMRAVIEERDIALDTLRSVIDAIDRCKFASTRDYNFTLSPVVSRARLLLDQHGR